MRGHGQLATLRVEQHSCHADNNDAQPEGQERQIRDVHCDEEDENRSLRCKRERVAHLSQR